MSLPKHLEPATYWEHRCALLERACMLSLSVIADCLPPAAHDELHHYAREWDRLLTELGDRHPPPPGEQP